MKRIVLNSSAVASVAYDASRRALEVEFRGGGLYRYFDVDRSELDGLFQAPSVGEYVNRLKSRHRVRTLKRSPPPPI
jgi:hypothetical protein